MQVWGPLVFESRRFVELRQKSLWKQVSSAESTGMGLFYTLNIFCIQVSSDPACLLPSELKNKHLMSQRAADPTNKSFFEILVKQQKQS